ncbi:oligopeptide/dipeptide ABC transporter, ATP-binding protein [Treponema sp. JC4]|uniref:oligopeptide/dipeptide ABC transporter ATP-binding protein n=1 Tax=Treponema sp. JC4 TaxID=1124982 RepID=UPI00025B0717|nr:ABC transporter ATP-binding protein [Treponema sp. JC4]EID85226.1 oligopeptide/dipeptide ABC transporter, ATP-binding protein [Treponema sp. JC4]
MENIIEVKNLYKQFNLEAGFFAKNKQNVYAVNDLSFDVERGTTYGIVGESGCGKTTTAKMLIQLYRQTGGEIFYYPESGEKLSLAALNKKELSRYREEVKYIFQDPARSLNPRMSVFDVITAGLRYSSLWQGKKEALERAETIIKEVGLKGEDLFRRPAEFSGGQRQRISIARGLIMNPRLILCDEVVSALDVSIQGQIINLLSDLKAARNLTYVFITHDLKVACYFCDKIGVMYRGVLVEEAPAADLYKNAAHPYTKLLFNGAKGELSSSNKEVKTTLEKENCCPFAYRCPHASDRCSSELPQFRQLEEGHRVRCFLD